MNFSATPKGSVWVASGALLFSIGCTDISRQDLPVPGSSVPASPGPSSAAEEGEPYLSVVAHARATHTKVFRSPSAPKPFTTLTSPTAVGAPLVFLVTEESEGWVRVRLPIRPNGSEGWVRTSDVKLLEHRYRIKVDLSAHRIVVTKGERTLLNAPVGIGTQDTPTPGGLFYIKELLKPPDPDTIYGTYAYGLSGFSNRLKSFAGGEGVIGIHGTNAPWSVGQTVSHGCIRMYNEDIEKLVPYLPLGTPVRIVR